MDRTAARMLAILAIITVVIPADAAIVKPGGNALGHT